MIRLDALRHNIKNIQARLQDGCQLMAVLKGDGYGHGIAGMYETFRACGVKRFAVAVWEEGVMLRRAGCTEPILILGDTCDDCLDKLLEFDLIPTVFDPETAAKLNALAQAAGVRHSIHIKIDTGMSRIGFPADDRAVDGILRISRLDNLRIEGIFTHFARADEPDGLSVDGQLEKFTRVVEALEKAGVSIPMKHVSNSPATLLHPKVQMDAVRCGDILFALNPVDLDLWEKEDFRQVLHWYTQVAMVKEVPAGTAVGYGGTFVTSRATRIATLPIGFADGYNRALSNKGHVRIHDMDAPIIGRVCMDQMMVDVTDIPDVRRGDTAVLLDDVLTIHAMADLIGVNVDEIVCNISKRVPRIYE